MVPLLHGLLLLLGGGIFAFVLSRRIGLLRRCAPDPRLDRVPERLRRLLVVGFGQSRQPRYPVAGILHILIFFGFLILSIRSLTLLGEGFVPGFALPGLGGRAGEVYGAIKDWTALVVLVCCVVAALRRLLAQPARYHDRHATVSHHHEAYLILGLISTLMLADAVYEGSERALVGEPGTLALPLASAAAGVLGSFSEPALDGLHVAAFWVHNVALLFFLCYLPVSKHFHVITALPNVFFSKLTPLGRVKPARHGVEDLDEVDALGVGALEDFTWKHVLDFYSCTDCGRCSDNCPAYATGTPLSPRMISIKCRDHAYETYPILGRGSSADERPALLGDVVKEDELWACTTCGACEDACPVLIQYVDKVVDMRRRLVEDGRVPASLQKALADVEKRGNPYGKMPRKRSDWIKDPEGEDAPVCVLKKGEETDALFFTDSCTAYDPRIQQIGRAFARVLAAAGVEVGTLGKDEVDAGNEVRRIGEEGLFEVLRDKNVEALEARDFEQVVTNDPHAWNALRCDGYGLEKPVSHHTEVMARLLEQGRLKLRPPPDDRIYVFHDPCYLGRWGGVFDAPRQVLSALGLKTAEMERNRNRSFCCGGGSLYLFYEGESESRMGEKRVEMAAAAGAEVVVTACPFCLINLEDAILTTGRSESLEVIDLAELVARHLEPDPGQLARAEES